MKVECSSLPYLSVCRSSRRDITEITGGRIAFATLVSGLRTTISNKLPSRICPGHQQPWLVFPRL